MSHTKRFKVQPKQKIRLAKIDPNDTAGFADDEATRKKIDKYTAKLRHLQYDLYAENKQSLLVCLQGLDASGKDGTIRHVFSAMNPQGTRVHSFKTPSSEEASQDFLWRVHKVTPARGTVAIFNRSHYEDVLIARVHKLVDKSVWSARYAMINDFERLLTASGTRIVKIFLHIDADEQLERFSARLDDPSRRWKISEADYEERKLWPAYIKAYEDCLRATSTKLAPWYVIPANHKWFRDMTIAKIIVETMQDMEIQLPKPQVDIDEIRKKFPAARN